MTFNVDTALGVVGQLIFHDGSLKVIVTKQRRGEDPVIGVIGVADDGGRVIKGQGAIRQRLRKGLRSSRRGKPMLFQHICKYERQ